MNPFLSLNNKERLKNRLYEILRYNFNDISRNEVEKAVNIATKEEEDFKLDIRKAGEEALNIINQKGLKGIVLAGSTLSLRSRNKSWYSRINKLARYGSINRR